MTEQTPAPADDLGALFLKQVMDLWVSPALAKRQAAGELKVGQRIVAIQVVFFPDNRPLEVRVNGEVKGIVIVPNAAISPGQLVYEHEVDDITGVKLIEDERDCGHVTVFLLRQVKRIFFDFRRNLAASQAHADAAKEFYATALYALDNGHMRAFVDNLYSAAELAVRAFLLTDGDPRFRPKTHRAVSSQFNKLAQPGRTHSDKTGAFNNLETLRQRGRYLEGMLDLDVTQAREMLATVSELISSVDRGRP